jgi:uncharacterized protein (TIGR02268 family)
MLPAVSLAQAGGLEAEPPVRQLELTQVPQPELWGAPGQSLLVLLDAPLDMEAMRQARAIEGLRHVEVAERSVTLLLSAGVKAGARLKYTLRFADGQPAEGVTLVLRVDSAKAEPAVEVYRGAIPATALRRQLNARVEPLLSQEASLLSLMAAGLLVPGGVRSLNVKHAVRVSAPGLALEDAWLHVASGRMALEVTLTLPPGAPPWAPGAVQLTERSLPGPLPVRGLKLLGGAVLQPGTTARLLVEWDTPVETQDLKYTLEVDEQNGKRVVRISNLALREAPPHATPGKEKKP